MNNANLIALDTNEIELVSGGIGGWPDEPTFQDYIDLAERTAEDTLERLLRNQQG